MSLKTNIQSFIASAGATVRSLLWLPNEPASSEGKSYAPFYTNGTWQWAEVPPGAPPLDLFIPGWSTFPFSRIEEVLQTGSAHAAVSFGPEIMTLGGVAFEQSSANTGETVIPSVGWTGTNWLVERESSAPMPSGIGNTNGRTEVTAFSDLPDPSLGDVANLELFCKSSMRRNHYITISNLTVGNRYYFMEFYGTYPDSLKRATKIDPSDGGDSVVFGVDDISSILERGIRRYGFTAASTEISFQKYGPDNSGSFCNGFYISDEGTA